MQAYGQNFARVYNQKWNAFVDRIAPFFEQLFEDSPCSERPRRLLDIGCGTGRLADYFLKKGYRVWGMDLSAAMLQWASRNLADFIETGQGRFVQADAAEFSLGQSFHFATSTYDALNHLPGEKSLRSCFDSVVRHLAPPGVFIFDMNTTLGLRTGWNNLSVREEEDATIITRSMFHEDQMRAYTCISGFVKDEQDTWSRFSEVIFNTAFSLERVQRMLLDAGFRTATFHAVHDLKTPLTDPENERRIFCVARLIL